MARILMSAAAVLGPAFPVHAADCDILRNWITAGPVPASQFATYGRPSQGVMELIRDARFSAAFGVTYDKMSAEDLQRLGNSVVPACIARGAPLASLPSATKDAVNSVFSPRAHDMNVAQLRKSRDSSGNIDALVAELDAMRENDAAYDRYVEIRADIMSVLPGALQDARANLTAGLGRAELRVAIPAEARRVDKAIASASGLEGMEALAKMRVAYVDEDASDALRTANDANRKRLSARITEISRPVAADERRRIDSMGSGIAAVEAGAAWHARYDARYRQFADDSPEISALPAYLQQRRGAQLAAAEGSLREMISATRSDEALHALVSKYLLPSDHEGTAGKALFDVATSQSSYLRKRRILGDQLDVERAARQPDGQPGSQPNRVADEPTSEDIYDALQEQYDIVAETQQSMNRHCSAGGATADLSSMAVCMGLQISSLFGVDTRTEITKLRKLECVRAAGRPGVVCDYLIARSGGEAAMQGAVLGAALADGVRETSRFVRAPDGIHWQLMKQDISE